MSVILSELASPTVNPARPPGIGNVASGFVWPKSTLASTGRFVRRPWRAMICSRRSVDATGALEPADYEALHPRRVGELQQRREVSGEGVCVAGVIVFEHEQRTVKRGHELAALQEVEGAQVATDDAARSHCRPSTATSPRRGAGCGCLGRGTTGHQSTFGLAASPGGAARRALG